LDENPEERFLHPSAIVLKSMAYCDKVSFLLTEEPLYDKLTPGGISHKEARNENDK